MWSPLPARRSLQFGEGQPARVKWQEGAHREGQGRGIRQGGLVALGTSKPSYEMRAVGAVAVSRALRGYGDPPEPPLVRV